MFLLSHMKPEDIPERKTAAEKELWEALDYREPSYKQKAVKLNKKR